MKKTILCLVVLFTTLGCRKDADLPKLEWSFDIKKTQNIPILEVNNSVKINFEVITNYIFEKAKIKYKVLSEKECIISNDKGVITQGVIQDVETQNFTISYTGKQVGEHNFKVVFFNEKGYELITEIPISFKEIQFEHTLTNLNGEEVYQGDSIKYLLSIKPLSFSQKDTYQIMFLNLDSTNENIYIDNKKIEANQWIPITNIQKILVNINRLSVGNKTFEYCIKNNSYEKCFSLSGKWKIRTLELENIKITYSVYEIENNGRSRRPVKVSVLTNVRIKKTPFDSLKIFYKIWVVDNEKDIVFINDNYKETSLTSTGQWGVVYEYISGKGTQDTFYIQFKDEYGNETVPEKLQMRI